MTTQEEKLEALNGETLPCSWGWNNVLLPCYFGNWARL